MLVLDANILIRAVLRRRIRPLLGKYTTPGHDFRTPEIAYIDAEKHLIPLLKKREKLTIDVAGALAYPKTLVVPVSSDTFEAFEYEAGQRLRRRDEEDWPILAVALAFACDIWTEDTDFFGTGVAVWTSDRVGIFLDRNTSPRNED